MKKSSIVLIIIGTGFLLFAIFGRYLVLPGYFESLERGLNGINSVSEEISGWKIARYLLWAYSFKLGILLIASAAVAMSDMKRRGKALAIAAGALYILFAYIPIPWDGSLLFGITGGIMTLLMLYIFLRWAKNRRSAPAELKTSEDLRLAGYFFFAMATYTLCPLLGVKGFALSPEKMIRYGVQAEATSFAVHVLIELLLGWVFTAAAACRRRTAGDVRQ